MNFKEITLGDGTVTLISVDSTPNLIRRGVLTLTVEEEGKKVKKPIYIVELAEENGGGADIVSVYGIKANSKVVQKDYEEIIVQAGYKETTELAKVASKILKARKGGAPQKREIRTKPPLFLAPVVESIGTFTNVVERGFFEREPDRFRVEDGKPYIQYGKNTGVFIGLNSIKWEKAYVNAGELADRYITDKELWFDFGAKTNHSLRVRLMEDNRFKEADIQQLILRKKRIFGDIGDSVVVFEKAIMRGRTICDSLVFTENRGLIGIEIKTERDTTNRLNKQLRDYEQVCDYTYVLCHDNHVGKVEKILNRYEHKHVGILSYTEFRGEPMLGIYKEAEHSPSKSAFHMLDILWKEEILKMLGTFRHYGQRVETATGTKFVSTANRSGGVNGLYTKSPFGRSMRKPQLIYALIKKVGGEEEATKVFCDVFIHNRQHPEKAIKYHHFLAQPIIPEEVDNV